MTSPMAASYRAPGPEASAAVRPRGGCATSAPARMTGHEESAPRRRRRWIGAAAVVAAGALGVVVWQRAAGRSGRLRVERVVANLSALFDHGADVLREAPDAPVR